MVKLLLGLDAIPKPHDAADALAVAICHLHKGPAPVARTQATGTGAASSSWRDYGQTGVLRLECARLSRRTSLRTVAR